MNENFQVTFLTIKKWSNLIILLPSVVMLILSLFIHNGWMFIGGSILLLLWLAIACMWIVPTGSVGLIRVLGKLRKKSFGDGPRFRIPIITETFLLSVMMITKVITDVKKVLTRNNLTITVTVTYQLEEKWAYLVFKMMGADYWDTHISKWVDAIIDTAVSKLTYQHFQAQKDEVESWVSQLVASELALKSSDMTEEIMTADNFDFTVCELVPARVQIPNPYKDPSNPAHVLLPDFIDGDYIKDKVAVSETEIEEIQRMELREELANLKGVNLFKNVSVKINQVKFEDAYEQARAQVAVSRAKVTEAELKAQAAIEAAKGISESTIIKAQGDSEAAAIRGEGEARRITAVKTAEGQILREFEELLRQTGLQHIPVVYGGNSNMLIDSKLILDEVRKRMGMGTDTVSDPDPDPGADPDTTSTDDK